MSELLDIVENPGPDISPGKLWLYHWWAPSACIQYVLRLNQWRQSTFVLALGATTVALKRGVEAQWLNFQAQGALAWLWLMLLAVAMWLVYQLYLHVIHWFDKRGNSADKRTQLQRVFALSMMPVITSLPVYLPKLIMLENATHVNVDFLKPAYKLPWLLGVEVLLLFLFIWSAVIFVMGTAAVYSIHWINALIRIALPVVLVSTIWFLLLK